MSEHVDCYVLVHNQDESVGVQDHLLACAAQAGLGITFHSREELYGFPEHIRPQGSCLCFWLGDRPGYNTASYLIDYVDYAPEAEIGMPRKGADRLALLVKCLRDMLTHPQVCELVSAMMECGQIDASEEVVLSGLERVLERDFKKQAPPNKLYRIRKM